MEGLLGRRHELTGLGRASREHQPRLSAVEDDGSGGPVRHLPVQDGLGGGEVEGGGGGQLWPLQAPVSLDGLTVSRPGLEEELAETVQGAAR